MIAVKNSFAYLRHTTQTRQASTVSRRASCKGRAALSLLKRWNRVHPRPDEPDYLAKTFWRNFFWRNFLAKFYLGDNLDGQDLKSVVCLGAEFDP
jgi:hypothetical protein